MCGIVGLMSLGANGFTQTDVTIFEQMLYADQLRGHHGTGLFYDRKDKTSTYIRGAMPAVDFLVDKEVKKHLSAVFQQASFVVGHNRWATRGAHTNDNTHPFNEGHITLVHNGTLYAHRKMKNVDVDSHAVCHAFSEKNEREVIKEIDGAFAFVWYNEREGKLYFTRNSQRPLAMVKSKEMIAIASEPKMAEWIFSRHQRTVTETVICEVGKLYSFDRESKEIREETIELLPFKEKETTTYYGGISGRASGYWRGQVWIPFYHNSFEEKHESNVKYLPGIKENTTVDFTNARIGDKVEFTPLNFDKKGHGYTLVLIVQGPINSPNIYATFYHNDKAFIDRLMECDTVEAVVSHVRLKHGVVSYVVRDVMPKAIVAAEMDYSDIGNEAAFPNNGYLN